MIAEEACAQRGGLPWPTKCFKNSQIFIANGLHCSTCLDLSFIPHGGVGGLW